MAVKANNHFLPGNLVRLHPEFPWIRSTKQVSCCIYSSFYYKRQQFRCCWSADEQ